MPSTEPSPTGQLTVHAVPDDRAIAPIVLDGGTPPACRIQKNDVGSATLVTARSNTEASEVGYNDRLRFDYKTQPAFLTRHIDSIRDVLIGKGDQAAKLLTFQARGIMAELDEAQVEPEYGIGHKPYYPVRFWDFRSKYLDRTGWGPSVFPPFDGGDSGVVGIYGRHWPPTGWPAPFAGWTWSQPEASSQMPIGKVYGALAFTTPAELITDLWAACDDRVLFALDNAPWLKSDDPPSPGWEIPYRRLGTISGGDHLLTWVAENYDWKWPGNTLNIAALAYCMFKLTDVNSGTITYDNLLFESGRNPNPGDPDHPLPDGAVWLGYPASQPGFTKGHKWDRLMIEAQGRGELHDWTWDFTPLVDSAGNAWASSPPDSTNIGTKYSAELKKDMQDDVDVVMGPDYPPAFHMFNKGGVPADFPGVGGHLDCRGVRQVGEATNLASWAFDGQG